jgi:MtN3 and saliva related transmembrane protein
MNSTFLTVLGVVAGLCTSAAVVPQLIKTIKVKKAEDVSPFMFIITLTGNALWIYYGVSKTDAAIISTNILSFVLNSIMLYLNLRYKGNSDKSNG